MHECTLPPVQSVLSKQMQTYMHIHMHACASLSPCSMHGASSLSPCPHAAFARLLEATGFTADELLSPDNQDVLTRVRCFVTWQHPCIQSTGAARALRVLHGAVLNAMLAPAHGGATLCSIVSLQVLTYHVVPGVAARAADLSDGQEIPTLNEGQAITASCGAGRAQQSSHEESNALLLL
jgi:hypothetical protein